MLKTAGLQSHVPAFRSLNQTRRAKDLGDISLSLRQMYVEVLLQNKSGWLRKESRRFFGIHWVTRVREYRRYARRLRVFEDTDALVYVTNTRIYYYTATLAVARIARSARWSGC